MLYKLSSHDIEKCNGRARLGDGGGLWLNVTATGTKSWIFRWTPRGGSPREMGLGGYPSVSLTDARKAAALHRVSIETGKDPKSVRDLARISPSTFSEVVLEFMKSKLAEGFDPESLSNWQKSLQHDCGMLSSNTISEIGPDLSNYQT